MNILSTDFADIICKALLKSKSSAHDQFQNTKSKIGFFIVDNLLPEDIALEISKSFPEARNMKLLNSLRENKYISSQMNKFDKNLENFIFSFQDVSVVETIKQITGLNTIIPDESLARAGLSAMGKGQFLNPHIDNSHDNDVINWRVLNLLYYSTPDWKKEYGGCLELWPNGLNRKQISINSRFNRLVVMTTHKSSLHSVSKVKTKLKRKAISNYYYSKVPIDGDRTFHVTSYRGRPEQWLRDLILRFDANLRNGIRLVFPKGLKKNKHIYDKSLK